MERIRKCTIFHPEIIFIMKIMRICAKEIKLDFFPQAPNFFSKKIPPKTS
jgi:hypothetical protein